MNNVIGYTQRELIEVMLSAGIHCSVSKFEEVAAAIQQKLIDATGTAVKIEIIKDEQYAETQNWRNDGND